jgi:hypothetical protein
VKKKGRKHPLTLFIGPPRDLYEHVQHVHPNLPQPDFYEPDVTSLVMTELAKAHRLVRPPPGPPLLTILDQLAASVVTHVIPQFVEMVRGFFMRNRFRTLVRAVLFYISHL